MRVHYPQHGKTIPNTTTREVPFQNISRSTRQSYTTTGINDGFYSRNNARYAGEPVSDSNAHHLTAFKNTNNGSKTARHKNSGQKTPNRKSWIVLAVVIGILILIYIGGAVWFSAHFYPGTSIDGVDVSFSDADNAKKMRQVAKNNWEIIIHDDIAASKGISTESSYNSNETGGITRLYSISADDIDYAIDETDIDDTLKQQSSLDWPIALIAGQHNQNVYGQSNYDKETLKETITTLPACDEEERTPAQDAYVAYKNEGEERGFYIEHEQTGTLCDADALIDCIISSMEGYQPIEINLSQSSALSQPKITADDPTLIASQKAFNTVKDAEIIYDVNGVNGAVKVDCNTYKDWLILAENGKEPDLDTEIMGLYYRQFGETYDTVGKTRVFTSAATGKSIEVSGGTYGWEIDEETEIEHAYADILANSKVQREPEYAQTASASANTENTVSVTTATTQDCGSTYIDVDKSAQHIWFVQNNQVVFDADVVTGLPTAEKETPDGWWSILTKERNKTLVGEIQSNGEPEYRTPVSYWLQVTWSGVGFHDATWQYYGFGGDIYTWNGSHGCINMSMDDVAALFDLVDVGIPVVIHS